MRVPRRGRAHALAALGFALTFATACTSILGDFSVRTPGGADSGESTDASNFDAADDSTPLEASAGGDADAGSSGRPDSGPHDSGPFDSGPPDAGPPDVGPPGAPGFGLSAGAAVMTSAGFKLYGVLGESPGGNTVSKSASYTLRGGVIGATN